MDQAVAIYVLCAVASSACAVLLLRKWRRRGQRLLLWSALCFVGLAVNNLVMVVDFVLLVEGVDLTLVRHLTAHASFAVMLYGLVWDAA